MPIITLRFDGEPTAVSSNLTWFITPTSGTHFSKVSHDPARDDRFIETVGDGNVDDNYTIEDTPADLAEVTRVKVRVRYKSASNQGAPPIVPLFQVFRGTTFVYSAAEFDIDNITVPEEHDLGWSLVTPFGKTDADDLNFRVQEVGGGAFSDIVLRISELYVDIDYKEIQSMKLKQGRTPIISAVGPSPIVETIKSRSPINSIVGSQRFDPRE